ncbi:hypothetical protein ABT168_14950 [Streptomyces sp. NPDC001793]|uniref:hypothetical protein n=1 Tax=Streptomyces sp. NPDC001793 TaxID=3154657 RepID=UPI0033299C55
MITPSLAATRRLRRALAATSVAALVVTVPGCAGGAPGPAGPVPSAVARAASSAPSSASGSPRTRARPFRHVPSQATCRRTLGTACYTADLVRRAYGVDRLNSAGLTVRGHTVVVFASPSPTSGTAPAVPEAEADRAARQSASFSSALAAVVARGTTLTASTGDSGAAPPVGPRGERVRSVSWPASDPSVFAVGGSRLHLDELGRRTGPDTVWHDQGGATGGGLSQTFARPGYQDAAAAVVGGRRGTPDISMDSSASGGTLVYQGFLPAGAGWLPVGGTSEAAPMFAALVALANQQAGRRLGGIHRQLYGLAADPRNRIIDITKGDNGPDGFAATPGYDLASGLGTVDAAAFVPKLATSAGG